MQTQSAGAPAPMLSLQQIFDKVAAHLLTQRKRSRNGDPGFGKCAYRGNDGTMCAVGCLIPDNAYDPNFEEGEWARRVTQTGYGTGVHCLSKVPQFREALLAGGVDLSAPGSLLLLERLQAVHDCEGVGDDDTAVSRWEVELRVVAEGQGLDPSVVDHFEGSVAC